MSNSIIDQQRDIRDFPYCIGGFIAYDYDFERGKKSRGPVYNGKGIMVIDEDGNILKAMSGIYNEH